MLGAALQLGGDVHKVSNGARVQFFHHLRPVCFDGALGRAAAFPPIRFAAIDPKRQIQIATFRPLTDCF